ncbi:MAG TPA: TAXI family TRAP transporter solute-binding subunit, partial [Burkholderiales bacterium]|nr:TAXI family TRAP transporter solute-binding subunit [Burkholderiales bacterium]
MQVSRLRELSWSAALALGLPALALVALGFWLAYQFVAPAPPKTLVMTTGAETGAYHAYARRYQEILARNGIRLELQPSSGAMENLKRLADPSSGVMVGFVQGGLGDPEEQPGLESLGAMYFEPLWVFHRGNTKVDRLAQLLHRRLAVGADGSGTQELAVRLLAANGITAGNTPFLPLGAEAAVKGLQRGEIDAALIVSGAE